MVGLNDILFDPINGNKNKGNAWGGSLMNDMDIPRLYMDPLPHSDQHLDGGMYRETGLSRFSIQRHC